LHLKISFHSGDRGSVPIAEAIIDAALRTAERTAMN